MGNQVSILILAALLLGPCPSAFGMDIPDVKLLPDWSPVTLASKVVTYAASDFFYIEEDSLPCGIRVEQPAHGLAVGMRANVEQGTVQTNANMERYIAASSTYHFGSGTIVPIYVNNRDLGGGDCSYNASTGAGQKGATGSNGANNIGLLVRTSGLFQMVDATTFTISDGAGLNARCVMPPGFLLYPGANYVSVTGISSMYPSGSATYAPTVLVKDVGLIISVESLAIPGAPTGSPVPLIGGTYTYSTTGSGCSKGHTVEYSFNWGDGTTSPWSTSKSATRSWSQLGAKSIKVTARCQTHPNLSVISQTLAVDVQSALSCEMVNVAAGSFQMGNTGSEPKTYDNELPKHTVTVSAFSLGKYEVTRGQYQRFINAGGYFIPAFWSTAGWNWCITENRTQPRFWDAQQNWGTPPGSFGQSDSYPVVGVSYYEAEAFCNWAGGHLPTEAQWEKASRWTGTQSRVYPWGNTWSSAKCNNLDDTLYPGYQTAPVGSYSNYPSPYGCQDMVGNVWEWCKDWYLLGYYSQTPAGGWVDPQGPADGYYRAVRGGGWGSPNTVARCSMRTFDIPGSSWFSGGFRLAR